MELYTCLLNYVVEAPGVGPDVFYDVVGGAVDRVADGGKIFCEA